MNNMYVCMKGNSIQNFGERWQKTLKIKQKLRSGNNRKNSWRPICKTLAIAIALNLGSATLDGMNKWSECFTFSRCFFYYSFRWTKQFKNPSSPQCPGLNSKPRVIALSLRESMFLIGLSVVLAVVIKVDRCSITFHLTSKTPRV